MPRTRAQVAGFLYELEVTPPGVTDIRARRRPRVRPRRPVLFWGGAGRVPAAEARRTPATPAGTAAETAVSALEALGTELGALGLRTRLVLQARAVPYLHVTSPAGPALAESIRAAFWDGTWTWFWSWGVPVPATAPGEAAALISRVLRTATP